MRFILTDNVPNSTVEFDKLMVGEKFFFPPGSSNAFIRVNSSYRQAILWDGSCDGGYHIGDLISFAGTKHVRRATYRTTVPFEELKIGEYFRYTGMTESEPSVWCKITDSRAALLKGPYNNFSVGANEFFPNVCSVVPLTLTVEK